MKQSCLIEKYAHIHLLTSILIASIFFTALVLMVHMPKDRVFTYGGFLVHVSPL